MAVFRHGKSAVIQLSTGTTGSTALKDIEADDVSFSREAEEAEVTIFGATFRDYIPGLQGAEMSISGPWSSTVHKRLSGIFGATSVTYNYSPESTSTGRILLSGTCVLTSYEHGSPAGDRTEFSASLRLKSVTSTSH